MYSFDWVDIAQICEMENEFSSPMNEDPLLLIPSEHREKVIELINEGKGRGSEIRPHGDLCPPSRYIYHKLIEHYDGDWEKVVENHVRIRRLVLSEKDRVGIGTFQPKDEKIKIQRS